MFSGCVNFYCLCKCAFFTSPPHIANNLEMWEVPWLPISSSREEFALVDGWRDTLEFLVEDGLTGNVCDDDDDDLGRFA